MDAMEVIAAHVEQVETPESAPATPEVTGEQPVEETPEVVEEAEPTPAEEDPKTKGLLKAAQEERRKRQEIKEDRDFWYKVATGEIANPVKAESSEKPKPEQFESYDDYVEALADYKAEQAFNRRTEQSQTQTRQQMAQREEERLLTKAKRDAEEAAKRYEDFGEVVKGVNLPPDTLKAMYASEVGPDLAYYLGKNPSELERITELSPQRQIMELGKLEVKIASKTANPDKKQVRQATQVEKPGNGFEKPTTDLKQLRDKGIRSGNMSEYLMAAGLIPD